MDIATIVVQELVQLFLDKGLTGGYQLAKTLVSKLRHHFAKDQEATEALNKLQQSPGDPATEQAFKNILSARLVTNSLLAAELQATPDFPLQLLTVSGHGQVDNLTGDIEGTKGVQSTTVTEYGVARNIRFGIRSGATPLAQPVTDNPNREQN